MRKLLALLFLLLHPAPAQAQVVLRADQFRFNAPTLTSAPQMLAGSADPTGSV